MLCFPTLDYPWFKAVHKSQSYEALSKRMRRELGIYKGLARGTIKSYFAKIFAKLKSQNASSKWKHDELEQTELLSEVVAADKPDVQREKEIQIHR